MAKHCENHRICASKCAKCQQIRVSERPFGRQVNLSTHYPDGQVRTRRAEYWRRMTEIGLRYEKERRK